MDKLYLIKDPSSQLKVKQEIERFITMSKHQSEYHKTQTWLDDVFSIPWETSTPLYWNIEFSKNVLEKRIFGLEKVKLRILEMIATNKIKK
jgi:ATP-dependent Lon protease